MCCRLYFGRIVPTILDYLSAGVEMPTQLCRSMPSLFNQRAKSCALHSKSMAAPLGLAERSHAGDILDS
jgi:hypothetical protein